MKRLTWLLPAVTVACAASGPEIQEFDGEVAYGYVERQVEFGPRVPGTAGHRNAGDWIVERLRATADTVYTQEWVHVTAAGDSLPMRNIMGSFRPELTSRVLYVAHWDTRPMADESQNLGEQRRPIPGANDGGSGVAVLLGVADVLSQAPAAWGVDLLFVDGEDYGVFADQVDVLIGAKYFAANLPEGYSPLFGVLFDLVGWTDARFLQEGHSIIRAPEVVSRIWQKARDIGYGRIFRNASGGPITDDHIPLLDAGIRIANVVDHGFINSRFWHTMEDTPENVSAESLQVVGDVAVALLR